MKRIGFLWIAIVLTIMAAGCFDDKIKVTQGDMNESSDITFKEARSGWRVLSNDVLFDAYISADYIDAKTGAVPDLEIVCEDGKRISTGDLVIEPGKDLSGQECYFINSTDYSGEFTISLGMMSQSEAFRSGITQTPFEGTMLIYSYDLEPKKLRGEKTEAFLVVSGKL